MKVSGRLRELWPYDNVWDLVGKPIKDENGKVIGQITEVFPGTDNPSWVGEIYDNHIGLITSTVSAISMEVKR